MSWFTEEELAHRVVDLRTDIWAGFDSGTVSLTLGTFDNLPGEWIRRFDLRLIALVGFWPDLSA